MMASGTHVRSVTVLVEVPNATVNVQGVRGFRVPLLLGEFGFDPRSANGLSRTFTGKPPTRLQHLTIPFAIVKRGGQDAFNPADEATKNLLPLDIARDLLGPEVISTLTTNNNPPDVTRAVYTLKDGDDGDLPAEKNYEGDELGFQDFLGDPLQEPKNGLLAFEAVEGISIVAAP